MESKTTNNDINAIKEVRELFIEVIFLVKKQRELDIILIKKKLYVIC